MNYLKWAQKCDFAISSNLANAIHRGVGVFSLLKRFWYK
ncbi:LOW QUALITY PROTEIN: hypothetical protein PanWU01x14_011360 [Parasponia andersonii]|uniref:Uncharacterized protein n=1 Tax=Parasponia andersonii TaxID=3476 RepID=A0A2P5E1H9_PARAD|nr:LOW QUALITY PROTEIN: hypothetical protein PanWU01x14_011360 [Parasponia andersonii]